MDACVVDAAGLLVDGASLAALWTAQLTPVVQLANIESRNQCYTRALRNADFVCGLERSLSW